MPSFGHHPLRLSVPCTGSAAAVAAYLRHHPEHRGTLDYFDAAVAARWLTIPTHFICAAFDPSVPPPGQFAVHNAAAGPKQLAVVPTGHFDYPQMQADYMPANRQRDAMLARL